MSANLMLNADLAERDPDNDLLGHKTLAHNIAKGIANMAPPEGIVMAITGGWGTGKTTTINFVRHYLKETPVQVIDFNPWWFSGHEDLCRKLLQELARGTEAKDDSRRRLGELLHTLAEVVDNSPVELKPSLLGFSIDLKKVAKLSAEQLRQTKSVSAIKEEISGILSELPIKFLVVIDDVDRLAIDDIRDLFRTIKALGDLPNVVYLIALDRDVVSTSLDTCFPGRGAAYLDKIIQVPFDLPTPSESGIKDIFISGLNKLLDGLHITEIDSELFWTHYRHGISKMLTTPRQAIRLINALHVTLPSVLGEVNVADFVALESCRLFMPDVYNRIRNNKNKFAGYSDSYIRRRPDTALQDFHTKWVAAVDVDQQDWLKEFLSALFPKFHSALRNTIYGSNYNAEWRLNLRACSPDHFDTFFGFSLPSTTISLSIVRAFISAANSGSCKELISDAIRSSDVDEKNRLWQLLDRLEDHLEKELTEDGAKTFFIDFLSEWSEYKHLQGVTTVHFIDNDLLVVTLLYKALKRSKPENRKDLLLTAIKRNWAPEILHRLIANLAKIHGKYGGPEESNESQLISAADFATIANEYCNNIQDIIDSESATDPDVLCRMLYFVREIDAYRIPTMVSRLQKTTFGLIALISCGTTESIPLTGANTNGSEFSCNLGRISEFIQPEELAPRIKELIESSTLDNRSLAKSKRFLQAYENKDAKTTSSDIPSDHEDDEWTN